MRDYPAPVTDAQTADAGPPPGLSQLTFHGPLSEARAARIVARLAANQPRTVLDIGCGWGELMLRVLAAVPGATGLGLDTDDGDLARGRANAQARGLGDRAAFVRESAVGTARGPADLVLCVGSSHALTDIEPPAHRAAALAELRRLVNPGGRVLLGEGFWHRTPAEAELARAAQPVRRRRGFLGLAASGQPPVVSRSWSADGDQGEVGHSEQAVVAAQPV